MDVFYTKTYNTWNDNIKKQEIVERVSERLGYKEISFFRFDDKCDTDVELDIRMEGIMAPMGDDDILIFQYPSMVSLRYDSFAVKHIKKGTKLIIFVQDLGCKVCPKEYADIEQEIALFNRADLLILQSETMCGYLRANGLKDIPVLYQKMWDYPYNICRHVDNSDRKIDYISNISIGALLDDTQSGFGLCADFADEYQNMCNPVRMGFYLCKGMPVIAKENSSLSQCIKKYNVGIVKETYEEAEEEIHNMREDDRRKLLENVEKIGLGLSKGIFTGVLLQNAVFSVWENKIVTF